MRSMRPFLLLLAAVLGLSIGTSSALAAAPGIVSRAPGSLEIFKRNPSTGNVNYISWNHQSGWGSWHDLGGPIHPDSAIGVVSTGPNHLSFYIRGNNDRLYQRFWDGGASWSDWQDHGGTLTGGPGVVAWGPGREDVFVRDTGGGVAQKFWDGSNGWSNWVSLGGYLAPGTGPAASSRQAGYLDIAVTGGDRRLYIKSYRPDTGWFDFYGVDSWLAGGPGIASVRGNWNGRQDYAGITSNNELAYYTYENGGFNGWHGLGGQIASNRAPAPIWWSDGPGKAQRYDLATYGTGNTDTVFVKTWMPGSGWTDYWTVPNTPTQPAPVTLIPSGQSCRGTTMGAGSLLGVSLGWQPSRITNPGNADQTVESRVYTEMVNCLRGVGGQAPSLRMQFPIDGLRSVAGGRGSMESELYKFRDLLNRGNVAGSPVVSIMSHDYTNCAYGSAQPVPSLAAGVGLGSCKYPQPTLYRQLFSEVKTRVEQILGRTDVLFTVWNEPDKKTFTLQARDGANNGAKLAGQFYAKVLEAPALIATNRLLAGEFAEERVSDSNTTLVTLSTLRQNFLAGAGRSSLDAWSLHPYFDMTRAASGQVFPAFNGFQTQVWGSPLYATEVGARLADAEGSYPPNGNKSLQWRYGDDLRRQLATGGTRAYLYHLTAGGGGWDSGFADRSGRARGSLCGLAQIPVASCLGNASAWGS